MNETGRALVKCGASSLGGWIIDSLLGNKDKKVDTTSSVLKLMAETFPSVMNDCMVDPHSGVKGTVIKFLFSFFYIKMFSI
jgi:hypothetical protein